MTVHIATIASETTKVPAAETVTPVIVDDDDDDGTLLLMLLLETTMELLLW